MNEFIENIHFYQQRILHMFILFSCFKYQFSAKTTKSGKFSIKLCEKVSMVSCSLFFDDKFLAEIMHVQSLIALSMQDYLPEYVLK